jgi:hypothetical protein
MGVAVLTAAIWVCFYLHHIEKQLRRIADSRNASATADRTASAVTPIPPAEANPNVTRNIETGDEERIDP